MDGFYWIGVAVTVIFALAVVGYAALWLYFRLIQRRFDAIFFQKGKRRLSLTSWPETCLSGAPRWPADDWPINRRPFYLSYRFGKRRLFVLAGILEGPRWGKVEGVHPDAPTPNQDNHP